MNTSLPRSSLRFFRHALLAWYSVAARDLPWRKTNDPYAIVVSELMLQQTQVDRVIPKYNLWMKRFPTIQSLAQSTLGVVLKQWQGLGYNRRARFLHLMAQEIVKNRGGNFPRTAEELEQLSGIGPYTARAIQNFAFHIPAPIVETNVRRVLSRFFFGFRHTLKIGEQAYWSIARQATPRTDFYKFNQALMDFGATVCTAKSPKCLECPMQVRCASYPKILTAQKQALRVTTTAKEKLYFGQPRRIWRGRILRYLHSKDASSKGSTLTEIGHAIQSDFTAEREPWLRAVIATLIEDTMVVRKKTRYTLPK